MDKRLITTRADFDKIKPILLMNKVFFIDIESNSLDKTRDKIIGLGLGIAEGSCWYFPFRHNHNNVEEGILEEIIEILNNSDTLIGYNLKFDVAFLSNDGLIVKDQDLIDVIVMSRLCQVERFANLKLVESYKTFVDLRATDNKLELKLYKKNNKIKENFEVDVEFMASYCIEDVIKTMKLYYELRKLLIKTGQMEIFNLEVETTKTLYHMEMTGSKIDLKYCKKVFDELNLKIKELEDKALEITSKTMEEPVNLLSSMQVGKFFHSIGVISPDVTPKGAECWDEKALLKIDNPFIGILKEYRTLCKLRNTYFEPMLDSEILHCSFKNWGTVTGRLSCAEPNLQNIPRYQQNLVGKMEMDQKKMDKIKAMAGLRKTTGGQTAGGSSLSSWGFTGDESFDDADDNIISVRRLFVPRDDYSLYSFDFSQMEIRVFVSYLGNEAIFKEMGSEKFDYHTFVCKLVFGYDEDHADFKFYRQISKAITFGLIYGMGDDLLAIQMGKDVDEAKKFRKMYFDKLEGSNAFIKNVAKKIKERGYVFNKYGRRYFLPPDKSYVGVNYLIQGSTGDLVKDRMNHVWKYLEGKKSHILNQIHDELVVEVHKDEESLVVNKIKEILEENHFKIPLKVDVAKCYPSWAHKSEKS